MHLEAPVSSLLPGWQGKNVSKDTDTEMWPGGGERTFRYHHNMLAKQLVVRWLLINIPKSLLSGTCIVLT